MRAAVIENGVVANVIEVESLDVFPGLVDGVAASIGDFWLDGVLTSPEPEPLTEAETVAAYMAAVQGHMDATARSFGYDHLIAVISYAEEPSVPRYQNEGLAFRAWRSLVWQACEQVLAAVKAGEREAPTVNDLLAELPEAPEQTPP